MSKIVSQKRCNRCGAAKPTDLDNFPPERRVRSGLGPYCRPCARQFNVEVRNKARGGPPRRRIIAGERYGRLTALARTSGTGSRIFWNFRCDCGRHHEARASHVKAGLTQSCGCHQREVLLTRLTKHGGCGTVEYRAWQALICRCERKNDLSFRNYGGRGIKVCERWRTSFENFLADMGPKPSPRYSIDRINTNGNYEPGNVRWATATQQVRNRRNTVFIEWEGQRVTLAAACETLGVKYNAALKGRHEKANMHRKITPMGI